MKNFLVTLLVATIALGSWACNYAKQITTVRTDIPIKLYFLNDSIFRVESNDPNIVYSIKNDSVLKISYNGCVPEDSTLVVTIKTPKKLNVETARFLKIKNK